MRSLTREQQETLYRERYVPAQATKLAAEATKRARHEEIAELGATFRPEEFGGDPVAFVRGPSITINEREWFKHPDYAPFLERRTGMLARMNSDPRLIFAMRDHYRNNIARFITDWGMTYDPRSVNTDNPAFVPFVLFKKQREFVEWLLVRWRANERGLCEKSRESGVTWLAVAVAVALALFVDGIAIGFGSRKAELVDTLGNPDSIFEKVRMFVEALPIEFRGPWHRAKHGTVKRITFPNTRSIISGEGGDEIGRGGRQSIYFVDESASLERPALAEASLSQTTRCRIDISTPKGLGNPFEQMRHRLPSPQVFTFHWSDDPRKDQAWYDKQRQEAFSPVVVAQELDIDYAASVEGVLIPHSWVLSSFDAHLKLGIPQTGESRGALDVADEGQDLLAFSVRHGVVLTWVEEWAGRGGDIYDSVERAFRICDHFDLPGFRYDSDGLGAGVRGDARKVNEQRALSSQVQRYATPFRGSAAVYLPDAQDQRGRKNKDFFSNMKAQSWWALRERFRRTYLALIPNDAGKTIPCGPDDIISLSSSIDDGQPGTRLKLAAELSQPTFETNNAGKIVIVKTPEGTRSPNLADAVMINFSRGAGELRITQQHVTRASQPGVFLQQGDPQSPPRQPVISSGLNVSPSMLRAARSRIGAWSNRGL